MSNKGLILISQPSSQHGGSDVCTKQTVRITQPNRTNRICHNQSRSSYQKCLNSYRIFISHRIAFID